MGEELKNSIKAKLYDFAYTPFMSSYVISWILFNHKYLLVYFGASSLDDKLLYLGECHLEFLFPLYVALIYVFIYPAIGLIFYYVTLWYNKKSMKIKQQIEDETPITQEQAREIKREHYKLADERDQALEKLKESQKEHAEALANALKPLENEVQAHIAAHNVSDELIKKLEDQNKKLQNQLNQANEFLSAKNDSYAELEKKFADLEKQLASVGVVNGTAHPGRVQEEDVFAMTPNVEAPSAIVKQEDARTHVLRYFYEGNYKGVTEESVLDKIVAFTKLPRPKVKVIFNELVKEGILKADSYKYYQITDFGNQTLLELFDKTVQPEEKI